MQRMVSGGRNSWIVRNSLSHASRGLHGLSCACQTLDTLDLDRCLREMQVDLVQPGICEMLIRPVPPATLIECVSTILSGRYNAANRRADRPRALRYADVEMDLITYRVRRGGREIHLSPIEFRLLRHLLAHPEQVVTREELKRAAWQNNVHVGPRTVDVHVGRLRKALRSVSDKDLDTHGTVGRLCFVGCSAGHHRSERMRRRPSGTSPHPRVPRTSPRRGPFIGRFKLGPFSGLGHEKLAQKPLIEIAAYHHVRRPPKVSRSM